MSSLPRSERFRMTMAFAAIYLIWGSTFLGIRYAIETVPPFTMAGARFLLAGSILYGWARVHGAPVPPGRHWGSAFLLGWLLFLQGNGMVAWSEQRVSSGLAALLLTTIPLWMTFWGRVYSKEPLPARALGGLAFGVIGIGLLVGPAQWMGGGRVDPLGALALLFASGSWATGSIYAKRANLPSSPILSAGMQMFAGGALLVAVGALSGEWTRLEIAHVSATSILCIIYLAFMGSIVAFTAYLWLLHHTTASRVSTYAFVNPMVALFLGWLIAGEKLPLRAALAAVCILAAVGMILSQGMVRTRPAGLSISPSTPEA